MNQVIGGDYKGGRIRIGLSGAVTLAYKGQRVNLLEHIADLRSVNSSTDVSAATAGALAFGLTGAVVGAAYGKGHLVEIVLDDGSKSLAEVDATIYKSLAGATYDKRTPNDKKKELHDREKKKTGVLSKVLIVLLLVLFVPLFGMMLASGDKSTANTVFQEDQEINRWYAQADSEIAQMTDEEVVKYAQFLHEELETESGYGAHYYKYMRIIKKRNISCTGQSADGSTECHYNQ